MPRNFRSAFSHTAASSQTAWNQSSIRSQAARLQTGIVAPHAIPRPSLDADFGLCGRRPPHEGHQPHFLQENPTTRSMPHVETWAGRCSPPERHSHDPQWTRKNPRDRTPHSRKARNFR